MREQGLPRVLEVNRGEREAGNTGSDGCAREEEITGGKNLNGRDELNRGRRKVSTKRVVLKGGSEWGGKSDYFKKPHGSTPSRHWELCKSRSKSEVEGGSEKGPHEKGVDRRIEAKEKPEGGF